MFLYRSDDDCFIVEIRRCFSRASSVINDLLVMCVVLYL
jgi:hypothetical protein